MNRSSLPSGILALALLSLGLPATPAQETGGGWTVFHQIDGSAADANLGQSAASAGDVDGDGLPDLIFGAPGSAPGGLANAGSALVQSGVSGALLLQLDGTAAGDLFGTSVASVGDLNADGLAELIVGAPGASPGGLTAAGSAIVFDGATGTILYQFDGLSAGDRQGTCVANLGDVDGDGIADILFGAPGTDPSGLINAGTLWVYSGATGLLIFSLDGPLDGGWLGHSVARTSDLDADGIADIVVGAHRSSPNGRTMAGSVYLVSGTNGAIILQIQGPQSGTQLGFSVSGAGDVDGDGIDDLIAGAPYAATGLQDRLTGAVFVLSGATGNTLLTLEGRGWFENFGWSVASAGDINQNGFADIVVGAPLTQNAGVWHGTASIFDGKDSSAIFVMNGASGHSKMGFSVANAGNITGRGFDEFIFCANAEDPLGVTDAGSATVFGIEPYISSDLEEVSTSAGGTINFFIDFPDSSVGLDYRLLASASGKGPTFLNGLDIPLTAGDFAWKAMTSDPPPLWFTDSVGILDANGDATVQMIIPPDEGASFIGTMFYFSAVTLIPGVSPLQASIAVPLKFLP